MNHPNAPPSDTSAEQRPAVADGPGNTETATDLHPRRRRSRIRANLSRVPKLTATAIAGLGVLVTALTPIGGALAKVLPSYAPDARGPIAASLKVVVVEPDATLEDMRLRIRDPSRLRGW